MPDLTDPAQWVDQYGDYLYTYAYYRVNSPELARDLVQETFVSALHAKDAFQGRSSEKTWLVSILKRKIIDHYRKQSRSKEQSHEHYDLPFITEGEDRGQWDPNRRPREWPEQGSDIDREAFYKVLEYCLSLLPEKWSGVFRLKSIEELTTEEICKEMGITPSNLWVIMHRARLRLRECFENNWYD